MEIWLVTFGQRYAREKHPVSEMIHPDGVVAIHATDEDDARRVAFKYFGRDWSMVQPLAKAPGFMNFFPRGIIGQVMQTTGKLSFNVTEELKEQARARS